MRCVSERRPVFQLLHVDCPRLYYLEYLEAEFYSNAVHGHGLPEKLTYGKGRRGPVEGGREVPFKSRGIRQFAAEIDISPPGL